MSTENTSGQESAATTKDARITINYTTDARGRTYKFARCTQCGLEATWTAALAAHECGVDE